MHAVGHAAFQEAANIQTHPQLKSFHARNVRSIFNITTPNGETSTTSCNMLTTRLLAEAVVLFGFAVLLLAAAMLSFGTTLHLAMRIRRRNVRLMVGFRWRLLLRWSIWRTAELLLFAMCVSVWLARYRQAQPQGSKQGLPREVKAELREGLWVVQNHRMVVLM